MLHSTDDIHCYFVPLVGDIDGDGSIEIVAGKTVANNHHTSIVGIYRGTDLQQIGTINVAQQIYAGFIGPTALVRYPDGVYFCAIDYWCATSAKKRQRTNTSVTVVR